MIDGKFLNDYGILNSCPEDINAENAPLWTMEYILLKYDANLAQKLGIYISKCAKSGKPGVYNNLPFDPSIDKDKYTSPDQLIAFASFFYRHPSERYKIEEIWQYLKKHWFTYDNITCSTNFQRLMQLSCVAYIAVLTGRWWWQPLLTAALAHSCKAEMPKTSGKLKAWTMLKTYSMPLTEKICNKLVKNEWKNIFYTYFSYPDHPIIKLVDELYVWSKHKTYS